ALTDLCGLFTSERATCEHSSGSQAGTTSALGDGVRVQNSAMMFKTAGRTYEQDKNNSFHVVSLMTDSFNTHSKASIQALSVCSSVDRPDSSAVSRRSISALMISSRSTAIITRVT